MITYKKACTTIAKCVVNMCYIYEGKGAGIVHWIVVLVSIVTERYPSDEGHLGILLHLSLAEGKKCLHRQLVQSMNMHPNGVSHSKNEIVDHFIFISLR